MSFMRPTPPSKKINDREDQGRFEIKSRRRTHGVHLKRRQIREIRESLQKLTEDELLDGDQVDFEDHAKIGAKGIGQVPCETFMEIADGVHLVSRDLASLAEVAWHEFRRGRRRSILAAERSPKHCVDFFLVQYFFHYPPAPSG